MQSQNFVVDNDGKRIAVMLSIKEFERMQAALEELEDIKAYDAVKAKNEPTISLREAIKLRKQKKNG